ncbi:alpha/beta fold hydrolase [Hoyosella altamirensis]|uniref:Pimeloyl-ACP methyl ester carboxylesterase/putative sterol carrier protein n=1 Tax=Hoyosella altamirensis TaxID=616997 RepID=A0A839RPP9_9ACTN|nr:alpha/beta fold hydrolase [Hoyosella altamirensis]MBB3038775.1 pimeloyl-ACP methyl ester carboxylesterase/putative sterol carrier protein [Hoyosella altamirensis]
MTAALELRDSSPDHLLSELFPQNVTDTAFTHSDAVVCLDVPDHGRWTLEVHDGVAEVSSGTHPDPTSVVTTSAETLTDLLTGRRSGVDAFLDGDLTTRGSLATVLQIGSSFAPEAELPTRPLAREALVDGARTAYLEAGVPEGHPVVLLHGLGSSNASMLPLLAGLASDCRVLAPDIPGFGASEAPLWTYTAERMSRWLDAFLTATDARGATVIGNSMGGRLALELAMHDSEAASELVLLCPSPAFRRFRQFVPLVKYLPVTLGAAPRFTVPRSLILESAKRLVAKPRRIPENWFEAAADEFTIAMSHWRHRRAALSALINIYVEEPFGESGFWDRLPGMRTPALFIWGSEDRLVPAKFARHVRKAVPAARSVILPDCGHAPQIELPAWTLRLSRAFIRGPGRP